jgi:signal transduction histidine kinase
MIKDFLKTHTQGPFILQAGAYLVIFMVMLTFVINAPGDLAEWRFFGTVLALASLLVVNVVCAVPKPNTSPKARAAQQWVFFILSAVLILGIVWMSGQFDAAFLLSILCIQAGFKRGVWPFGAAFAAINLAAWCVLLTLMHLPFSTIVIVLKSVIPGIVFAFLLTMVLERYSQQTKRAEALLKELQTANAALEAARQKETDLAVAEERVRLARDIHDGLGHHLTILSIQLQAAGKLVERDAQAAAEAIRVSRSEAQAALEEVRYSVGALRQNPTERRSLPETLASLTHSFAQHTGIQASFACAGDPGDVPAFAREALYRAAQEGLTNAQKHAKNVQHVAVRLVYEPAGVRLTVTDDGEGSAAGEQPAPTGFGLAGLRERVTQLGGTFRGGPGDPSGFEIEISLPNRGNENDPGASG